MTRTLPPPAPPSPGIIVSATAILAGVLGLYHRWRKRRRDLADLAAMNEIERHDIDGSAPTVRRSGTAED